MKFTWPIFILHLILVCFVIIALLIFTKRQETTQSPSPQYINQDAFEYYFEEPPEEEIDFSLESLPRGSSLVFKKDFEFLGNKTWLVSDNQKVIIQFIKITTSKFRVPAGTELKITCAVGNSTLRSGLQFNSKTHSIIECVFSGGCRLML